MVKLDSGVEEKIVTRQCVLTLMFYVQIYAAGPRSEMSKTHTHAH